MEHESSFDELSKEGNMCNCGLDLDNDCSDFESASFELGFVWTWKQLEKEYVITSSIFSALNEERVTKKEAERKWI